MAASPLTAGVPSSREAVPDDAIDTLTFVLARDLSIPPKARPGQLPLTLTPKIAALLTFHLTHRKWGRSSAIATSGSSPPWRRHQTLHAKGRKMHFRSILLGGFIAIAAAPALAQGNSAINRVGTVGNVDASSISLTSDQGSQNEVFKLAPNVLVLQTRPANLADIKPNDFVASAARIGTDGKLHSTEVRIFPDAMRGVGEGQRPMNDAGKQKP